MAAAPERTDTDPVQSFILTPGAVIPEGIQMGRWRLSIKNLSALLEADYGRICLFPSRASKAQYVPFPWESGLAAERFLEISKSERDEITNLSVYLPISCSRTIRERFVRERGLGDSVIHSVSVRFMLRPKLVDLLKIVQQAACRQLDIDPRDTRKASRVSIEVELDTDSLGRAKAVLVSTKFSPFLAR